MRSDFSEMGSERGGLAASNGMTPMADIVERLRATVRQGPNMHTEAADEIERLRNALYPVAQIPLLEDGPAGAHVPRLYDRDIVLRARAALNGE